MTREMTAEVFGALTNHLWQSTLFAIAAGLMALAFRKNRANIRYWLWLSASLKFLLPFSLLISLGSLLAWRSPAPTTTTQAVSFTMEQITQPFPNTVAFAHYAPHTDWLLFSLLSVWALGFGAITLIRFKDWLSIRAAVYSSTPLQIPAPIAVRSSSSPMEPGVVGLDVPGLSALGISRPVLLLPAGIIERLTPPQLAAVLAHEACHVRRRDNLTATLHMIVETIFWFHPLVWWIGTRLVEERERACDEEVLRLGNDPHTYAESILNVCKFYVESPVTCVSGVTGSDLKKRVERIMKNRVGETLNRRKKLALCTAGIAALAVPFVVGALTSPRLLAQSATQSATATQWQIAAGGKMAFEVASVKPNKTSGRPISNIPLTIDDNYAPTGGLFSVTDTTLRNLMLFAYKTQQIPVGFPSWGGSDRFDIQATAQGNPTKDQMRLMVQSLLENRFKLAAHFETRQIPVFALILYKQGKTGPSLKPDEGACAPISPADVQAGNSATDLPQPSSSSKPSQIPCGTLMPVPPSAPGRMRIAGTKVTTALLVRMMTNPASGVDRPVLDRTGLSGTFDMSFEWTPRVNGPQPPGFTPDQDGPTFFEALQDDLGLKLQPQTGPVDVLVLDHVEQPSQN